jgi:acyl-CoA synthetase (AMP-forming)/AMP-acid ligase II
VGVPSFDPVTMFETIEAERCTVLSGVPTSYLAMLEHPRRSDFDLSSLRAGTCGGADCNPDILQACAREFPMPGLAQVYGQTETATLVACPAHDDPRRFATAGPPLPGHETRIVDPKSGAVLPAGEVGEIQARGPMVMQGYFEMRRETAETLDADGWLHTGDLGYLRRDGHLVIAGGRLRDMIIRGGENIYPVEIENLLQQHPAVERIAVFGMADAYYGERVAAAVVLGAPATAADLQGFCDGRIARFKVPMEIYVTETFPLTPSGKVRKVALREQAAAGTLRRLE